MKFRELNENADMFRKEIADALLDNCKNDRYSYIDAETIEGIPEQMSEEFWKTVYRIEQHAYNNNILDPVEAVEDYKACEIIPRMRKQGFNLSNKTLH